MVDIRSTHYLWGGIDFHPVESHSTHYLQYRTWWISVPPIIYGVELNSTGWNRIPPIIYDTKCLCCKGWNGLPPGGIVFNPVEWFSTRWNGFPPGGWLFHPVAGFSTRWRVVPPGGGYCNRLVGGFDDISYLIVMLCMVLLVVGGCDDI